MYAMFYADRRVLLELQSKIGAACLPAGRGYCFVSRNPACRQAGHPARKRAGILADETIKNIEIL